MLLYQLKHLMDVRTNDEMWVLHMSHLEIGYCFCLSPCLSASSHMTPEFVTGDESIPISSSSSATTTTSLDYHSRISDTVLVSVIALFLICSFIVFAQHCFSNHHDEEATAMPVHTGARSGSVVETPPPPGLDAAAVAELPVVRYTGGSGGGAACAVCLVEYGEEWVKVIPACGHGFHPKCIDTWLMRRGSCPVCRCSEMWRPWSGVWAGVFGCGERNGGKLRSSRSFDRGSSELEAGGCGGEMPLRRTISV